MREREMRIMLSPDLELRIRRGEHVVHVKSIPWGMFDDVVAPRQAKINHDQSLDRLNERGGVSPCEAIAIMTGSKWRSIDDEYAHRILYLMRSLYRRRALDAPGKEEERP